MSMPTYHITIADKIKTYRGKNNLSRKKFGDLIGVSPQAIYKWEHNICCPDIYLLPYLADILNCSVNDFFETR